MERAAARLDQASRDRVEQAKGARLDWPGTTGAKFDQTLDPALRQAGDLTGALRRTAGMIRQAMSDATAEQQRRLDVRAEYRVWGGMHPV